MGMMRFAHVDLNLGVDFEIEQERLGAEAGRQFRQYRAAQKDPKQTAADVDRARDAYMCAQARYQRLSY